MRSQVEAAIAAGKDVILRIDVQGSATVRSMLQGVVSIFLVCRDGGEVAYLPLLLSMSVQWWQGSAFVPLDPANQLLFLCTWLHLLAHILDLVILDAHTLSTSATHLNSGG